MDWGILKAYRSRVPKWCRNAALLVVLVTPLISCDETLTAPTSTELTGRWRLSSLQPRNGLPIAPPSGTDVGIEFAADRISVQSDCNVCSGRYTSSGTSFAVSLLACTRRACREGSIEGPFLQLLSTASSAAGLPGRVLKIEGRDGFVLFTR